MNEALQVAVVAAVALFAREVAERINEVRAGDWSHVAGFLASVVVAVAAAASVPAIPFTFIGVVGLWAAMKAAHEAAGTIENRRRAFAWINGQPTEEFNADPDQEG